MSYSIHNDATQWVRTHNDTGETNTAPDSSIPPETGWSAGSLGTSAPTLSYGGSPWVSGGEFTKLGYTDLLAHISGTGGVYFQWKPDGSGDACHLGPTITYDAFQAVTPSQYAQLKRWCERYTDTCGAGIADFGDL